MTAGPDPQDPLRWPRPVPLVGDTTSARQRSTDPRGWVLPPETRAAVYEVIDVRRDIRRFRPDPIDEDVLRRVLTAGHHAPSVGHSQPWRFLLVAKQRTRDLAALLADRERIRQARLLEEDAGRRLLDLQLEGIREAPLGIVVCCDRRTPAAGVLGRASFADADLWSCACAVENMWLAARAEGLGMGWVTLFQPDDLAGLLHLPDGVATLGWLCLGWPDERPPEPGLIRAGWSRRRPLDEVVLHDRWPGPGQEPASPISHLAGPTPEGVVGVRDQADDLLTTPGSLGVLDRYVDRVLALGHPHLTCHRLILAAADHAVTRYAVSAYDPSVTRDVVEATLAGRSLGAALASSAGLSVSVVDAGVEGPALAGAVLVRARRPRGDLVSDPALHVEDVQHFLDAGQRLGASVGESCGLLALGEAGIGNTTVAATLAAALLTLDATEVVGLGAGADSAIMDRKRKTVDRALARARRCEDLTHPVTALAEVGGPEIAILAGVILGAAAHRTAVVLDGFAVTVAGLIAVRLDPAVQANLIAGQRSRERGHALALAEIGLEPLLDLRLRAGEGAGAVLATQLLASGLAARSRTAQVR